MRVAIDCSGISIGGGATYLHSLLFALAEIDQENEYIIILFAQSQPDWTAKLPQNFQFIEIPLRTDNSGRRVWWIHTKLHKLIRKYQIDVLYSPNDQTSFFVSCPVVLGIQNIAPYADLRTSGYIKSKVRLLLLRQLTRVSTWKASKVLFVSNNSKEFISERLGISNEKGIAVHHGLSRQFDPDIQASLRFKQYQPYILSVSTIYYHKNYISLIRGFSKLLKEYGLQYNLVIAGRTVHAGYLARMKSIIADEGISSNVHMIGEVEYSQIPELYAAARLFAFPSYLETFGLPAAEAMASGVPVVTSDATVMPEICGDAALYFDPFDTDKLAEEMHKLLTNDSLWEQMRCRGLERTREFSWIKTAQKTLDILKSAEAES